MEQLLYVAVRAKISSVATLPYSSHSGLRRWCLLWPADILTLNTYKYKPNWQDVMRPSLLACDLSCYFLRVCHGVAAGIGSIVSTVSPLNPMFRCRPWILILWQGSSVVNLKSDTNTYKYRATGCYGLHSMFETYWSCPYDSMSLSNIMLLEDHESHASELLTRAHMHKITQHKSIQIPKTSQNNRKEVLFFH